MRDERSYAGWAISTIIVTIFALLVLASITIIIDPFFHFHKPIKGLKYEFDISSERYINNGIMRHFDYDAVITGTSMTENFKTTEFDALWSANSIKVPYSGASYKEIDEGLKQALRYNTNIRYVLRGLDRNLIGDNKDKMHFEESFYPSYLYDDMWFNDVKYVLNKSILFEDDVKVIKDTLHGGKTTTFDEYANWNEIVTFGKKAVLESYTRAAIKEEGAPLSDEEKKRIEANIEQNVTALPRKYPDVKFYYFFTPYSICYWDEIYRAGELSRSVEAEKIAIEWILKEDNIELYSFANCFNVICNLDNYKDSGHYSEQINSQILKWIHEGKYRLTKDNYNAYLLEINSFYSSYPYDELFVEKNVTFEDSKCD